MISNIFSIFFILMSLKACNSAKTPLERVIDVDKKWLISKQFTQENQAIIDPILGGPDFIKFENEKEASLKMGDMVLQYTYTIKNDSIFLSSLMSERKVKFKIDNQETIIDTYHLKWKLQH